MEPKPDAPGLPPEEEEGVAMTGNMPDAVQEDAQPDEQNVDELEQKLVDAMRALSRKNKMVEEYLENLAHTTEKPPVKPEPPKT